MFSPQPSILESPSYPEKAALTPNTLRYPRRLLHRRQLVARALPTPKRHYNLQRCLRRPVPDNRLNNLGDTSPR